MSQNNAKPSHILYQVIDQKGDDTKGIWRPIGAAWPTKNGKGFTIKLDAIPLTGNVVLYEPSEPQG